MKVSDLNLTREEIKVLEEMMVSYKLSSLDEVMDKSLVNLSYIESILTVDSKLVVSKGMGESTGEVDVFPENYESETQEEKIRRSLGILSYIYSFKKIGYEPYIETKVASAKKLRALEF